MQIIVNILHAKNFDQAENGDLFKKIKEEDDFRDLVPVFCDTIEAIDKRKDKPSDMES